MKKYIAPAIEVIFTEFDGYLCASINSSLNVNLRHRADWGNHGDSPYGNSNWWNEGGYPKPNPIDDEGGGIDSQSKKHHSIWDEDEEDW